MQGRARPFPAFALAIALLIVPQGGPLAYDIIFYKKQSKKEKIDFIKLHKGKAAAPVGRAVLPPYIYYISYTKAFFRG